MYIELNKNLIINLVKTVLFVQHRTYVSLHFYRHFNEKEKANWSTCIRTIQIEQRRKNE